MAGHISQADIVADLVVVELQARVREQEKQLREQEKEIERIEKLANSRRYSTIQATVIALAAMGAGCGLALGILTVAGCWSP